MPKKRKAEKPKSEIPAENPIAEAPPSLETLYLDELAALVEEAQSLSFLREKLSDLRTVFDLHKFLGYHHLALMTLRDVLRKEENENKLLREECARLRVQLEEFNIPTKALAVLHSDKEKEDLHKRLDDQSQMLKESEVRYNRLKADFENFRKRTEKSLEEAAHAAREKIVLKLLPALDNLELALAYQGASDVGSVLEGIRLIKRHVEDVFEKAGIETIPSAGHLFDPNLHEATESVITDDYPEDTVVEEIRKGYRLREKVIRPALVKVAKAGRSELDRTKKENR